MPETLKDTPPVAGTLSADKPLNVFKVEYIHAFEKDPATTRDTPVTITLLNFEAGIVPSILQMIEENECQMV